MTRRSSETFGLPSSYDLRTTSAGKLGVGDKFYYNGPKGKEVVTIFSVNKKWRSYRFRVLEHDFDIILNPNRRVELASGS